MTEWPLNFDKKEELTEPVLKEIAENLPSFAWDVRNNRSRPPDETNKLFIWFFIYCDFVKEEYFAASVENLKGSARSETRNLAGEAFDLIDQLRQYASSREANDWNTISS